MEKKMNFKNLDYYECPICGKPLEMFPEDFVDASGWGWRYFDCLRTRECVHYCAKYKISKWQRVYVKYYNRDNDAYLYEKAYKMVGVENERK